MHINTYSIVAYDPDEKAWGVAVASKFLAAAAVVSWAKAGAGAIATQAFARVSYGPDGLALLAEGKSAEETLKLLTSKDPKATSRQVGIVDAQGRVAAHTGAECHSWAGHKTGDGFTCQGNILTGPDTLEAMAEAYKKGTGELADRLVAALLAGDTVGGDKRGKQSAGVLIVKENGGYGGDNDRYIDLRVDDHEEPVEKLANLVNMHHTFFRPVNEADRMEITPEIAVELQNILIEEGYYSGDPNDRWDELSVQAFWALVGNENLEERWNPEKDSYHIDRVTLDYLRKRFGN